MQLAPKPYTVHPYDELKKMGCPWIDDVRTRVLKRIDEFNAFIKAEAEADGQPELANEEFLYERFKDNCEYGLVMGNLRLLKYFVLWFKVKLLYEMIGEWMFTDHDVEMYHYYKSNNTVRVHLTTYNRVYGCKNNNCPSILVFDKTCKWFISYSNGVHNYTAFYITFFYLELALFNDILRNVKSIGLDFPNIDFFNVIKPHPINDATFSMDFSEIKDISFIYKQTKIPSSNEYILYDLIHKKVYAQTKKDYISEKNKERYQTNKDTRKEQQREYRRAHREQLRNMQKELYIATKDKYKEYNKLYRINNINKIKTKQQEYRKIHRGERNEYLKNYRESHKEQLKCKRNVYYNDNHDYIIKQKQQYATIRKTSGYRYRKDPETGKHKWIFVGNN